MLTVGVLGASGLVGCRLVEILQLGDKARVVPIVRSSNSLASLARFDLDWRLADALDEEALSEAFGGCDVVVHAIHGPNELIEEAPAAAYRAAEKARVKRIVYLSTIVVHGQNPPPGTDESSPILTDHPFEYNNSKVRAERRFLALRAGGETELVVLRPGFVFGPRDRWVTNIVRGILNRSAYIVKGAGICNTIYVDNLAHAIELAMTADVDGEVFNITDRETVTWRELHEMASAAMGSDWEVPEIVKPRTVREHVAVIDRLKRVRAVSRLLPHVPRAWKLGAREVLGLPLAVRQSLAERRQARLRTPWVLDAPTTPSVPVATVLAHSCAWKLPLDKAVGRLGYAPEVSVEEGMRRTLAWLEFSGYPMAADTAG